MKLTCVMKNNIVILKKIAIKIIVLIILMTELQIQKITSIATMYCHIKMINLWTK